MTVPGNSRQETTSAESSGLLLFSLNAYDKNCDAKREKLKPNKAHFYNMTCLDVNHTVENSFRQERECNGEFIASPNANVLDDNLVEYYLCLFRGH